MEPLTTLPPFMLTENTEHLITKIHVERERDRGEGRREGGSVGRGGRESEEKGKRRVKGGSVGRGRGREVERHREGVIEGYREWGEGEEGRETETKRHRRG